CTTVSTPTAPALDSHCHLDLMDLPVQQALAQARAVGVETVVQVGVDLESSRWSAQVADEHRDVWAAVALHPNEAGAGAATDEALREIEQLAALPQVRAVGETGLDHYRTGPEGHRAQEESFRAHIAIAKAAKAALVIHDRDAHDDVLRVLHEEGAPEHVVFHCFSGDAAMARHCADRGWVMSFAGPLTFTANDALRAAAAVAPLDLLLVETDAPFLTPVPFRGRPNAPAQVALTLRTLAEVKAVPVEQLCAAVTENGRRVLGL
ncbi:MAG TPA: TatD family hydrolase, partial [Mycobacteriales bacterium]|nr:TatD family hydrolase [Mycobacteriales bacterium]